MVRKLITFAVAGAFLVFLPAAATEKKGEKSEKSASSAAEHHASGTIMAWDEATKEFTVKSSAGKETTFAWSDTTKVAGTPKVGERVKVEFSKDKEGKVLVTEIHAGARPTSKAAVAKK